MIAGLKVARHEWVVLLACDAPLVDRELIEDLLRLAVASDSAAMVRQSGYWQPMFSVLPRRVLPVLEQAWRRVSGVCRRPCCVRPCRGWHVPTMIAG